MATKVKMENIFWQSIFIKFQFSNFHLNRYMNFMFDLEDASDDGAIDANEFAIVCSSYGLNKAECEEAFGKMSQVIF